MGFTAIVSGIFAVAKAVPTVAKFIKMISDRYIDDQIRDSRNIGKSKQQKRAVLIKKMNEATDDNERIILSTLIHDVDNRK